MRPYTDQMMKTNISNLKTKILGNKRSSHLKVYKHPLLQAPSMELAANDCESHIYLDGQREKVQKREFSYIFLMGEGFMGVYAPVYELF